MTRLEVISSYIDDNEKVLDIGCDQALLSKLLAKRGIYSVASDIVPSIIENAKKNLMPLEKEYITFKVGNGITIEENDYTLVLSGMGTYNILKILSESKVKFNKIITISNNNHDILRKEMTSLGYYVKSEEIIKDKGKYYNLIIFDTNKRKYTKEDIVVGVNHKNKELLKEKNLYLINKYKDILKSVNSEKLKSVVDILENYNY